MGCNQSQTVPTLYDTVEIGKLKLKNRIVMAAMTRGRCDPKTNIPTELNAKYYAQRAGFGLILTECSSISQRGNGYYGSGAIFNDEQQKGWKLVVDEVHKAGGVIVQQIVHCGRVASENMLGGKKPLAPSAIAVSGKVYGTEDNYPVPQEMTQDDIKSVIEEFKKAAQRSLRAGFDGIEIHGANGYLIDQFLRSGSNRRTDQYGGSVENRIRFALQVVDAVVSVAGADRVGIKISPCGTYNDMLDKHPLETYSALLQELDKRKIAFVEITQEDPNKQMTSVLDELRTHFQGVIIGNSGFNKDSATEALVAGKASLISFAQLAIRNPDLPSRFQNNKPIDQTVDYSTMFFGTQVAYTDFQNAD